MENLLHDHHPPPTIPTPTPSVYVNSVININSISNFGIFETSNIHSVVLDV